MKSLQVLQAPGHKLNYEEKIILKRGFLIYSCSLADFSLLLVETCLGFTGSLDLRYDI